MTQTKYGFMQLKHSKDRIKERKMNNKLNLITLAIIATTHNVFAADLPQNGNVQHGSATIVTDQNNMTVTQSTPKVSIEWDSFDVGKQNTVEFKQPNSDAIAYNRVTKGNASQIMGKLNANGKVFLSNPNGVIISKDSQVNVGSLVATTKALENPQDIEKSQLEFKRVKQDEGEIINKAHIVVDSKNGYVVLVGDKVKNEGTLEAKSYEKTEKKKVRYCAGAVWGDDDCNDPWASYYGYYWAEREDEVKTQTPGQVILASGENFTLGLNDSYVSVTVDANTVKGLVQNDGMIITDDGLIELTAEGENDALRSVVNNNGLLQANHLNIGKSGVITLSSDNIELGEKSNIKTDTKLELKTNKDRLIVNSKPGSKITAKETALEVDKLDFTGKFDREDSSEYYNSEFSKLSNNFKITTKDKITISDKNPNNENSSYISTDALSSMLANSGKVELTSQLKNYKYPLSGFDISGDINVKSFKDTDSFLMLSSPNNIDIHDANINSSNGRLLIGGQLWNFRDNKPEAADATISISNSKFNLNNGSIGFSEDPNLYRVYYVSSARSAEEDPRSFYNVNIKNVNLDAVDELVIGGGFGKVNIDGLKHNGKMNTYIHGGNNFLFGGTEHYYEFGLRDLTERLTRSNKDQSRHRWNLDSKLNGRDGTWDLHDLVKFEFREVFGNWYVENNKRSHLDTEINIKNSDIKTDNGFVHLMAKNINLENSNINIKFDRQILNDKESVISRLGINGENTVFDNSKIRIEGADQLLVSPDAGWGAGFYLIGNLLGKNHSEVFVKSHQGYTMQTEGDVLLKGDKTPDDLKITVVNTGNYAEADGADLGLTNQDHYLSAAAITTGGTPNVKTILDNVTINAFAPNGAAAYLSPKERQLDIKDNAVFNFYEKPRIKNLESTEINGKANQITTEREYLRQLDSIQGIKATNLSSAQTTHVADNKIALITNPVLNSLKEERTTSLTICDEKNNCTTEELGNRHSKANVSIGELK